MVVFTGGEEVCESEIFEPLCAENQVIMMLDARYGRMRLGECAQVDYGYIGCYADVLEHLDSLCSGRRSCSLRIPDASLDKAKSTSPCPREFKTYLNASYKCLEGHLLYLFLSVYEVPITKHAEVLVNNRIQSELRPSQVSAQVQDLPKHVLHVTCRTCLGKTKPAHVTCAGIFSAIYFKGG